MRAARRALFHEAITRVYPLCGTVAVAGAATAYERLLNALGVPLDALVATATREAAHGQATAAAVASGARTIAILTAAIAIAVAFLLVLYIVRLISGLFDRIRTTAGSLASASTQMRAGATEAAAASSE